MKILMIGATGKFAGLLIPELNKQNIPFKALVRDDKKAVEARRLGATETVIGDLNDPDSLLAAAKGVDGVFHISPAFAPGEAQMGVSLVQACKAAGVKKFVFSGVYHPSLPMTNHSAKIPVEQAIYHSGMDFTILQPSMFMQNMNSSWDKVLESGKLVMPYSKKSKMAYVDYRDVAEVAALAFSDARLSNGTFELSAPGLTDRIELAEWISQATGRTIEPAESSFEDWARQAKIPSGPLWDGLAAMYTEYDKYGFAGGNSLVLAAILGREPRTLRQYVKEMAARKPELSHA
jgi:uncharacterized protein YbjT (DUF2867 family)